MTKPDTSTGKEIPLTQGRVVIVDTSDYDFLMQWKWHLHNSRGKFYAMRSLNIPLAEGGRIQKPIKMHFVLMPPPPGFIVDHINGDSLDNRKSNLRVCKQQQNTWNRKGVTGSSSKFKGVSFQAATKYWKAYIKTNDKQKHLGCYWDEEDAARAYNKAAKELHGDYAVLNPVEDGVCQSQINSLNELIMAAKAIVCRWDSPKWSDLPHTAEYVHALRKAIAAMESVKEPPESLHVQETYNENTDFAYLKVGESVIVGTADWEKRIFMMREYKGDSHIRKDDADSVLSVNNSPAIIQAMEAAPLGLPDGEPTAVVVVSANSSEISVKSVDEEAFRCAWAMWLHNTDVEKMDRDSALHSTILTYERFRTTKPVSVSLEKCWLAGSRRVDNQLEICGDRPSMREITKAILDAAGVPYVN